MMITVTSITGAKYRAFSGAALSIMDMLSDGFIIRLYIQEGNYGFTKGVLANDFAQLALPTASCVQPVPKMPKETVVREVVTLQRY